MYTEVIIWCSLIWTFYCRLEFVGLFTIIILLLLLLVIFMSRNRTLNRGLLSLSFYNVYINVFMVVLVLVLELDKQRALKE